MRYLIILLIAVYSYGGILDFNYLNNAKTAYKKGDFKSASENYSKVNSDEAKYDLANSFYKQKKYQKALDIYKSISNKDLEFKKLYNMGNAQAHLGKIDDAIKSYKSALKLKDDKDAKFNLDLLKKQKKKDEKKKKQDKKNKKDKGQNKKQDNKKSKDEKNKDTKKQKEKEQEKIKREKEKKRKREKKRKKKNNKNYQNKRKKKIPQFLIWRRENGKEN